MHTVEQLLGYYNNRFGKNFFHEGPAGLYQPVNHIMNMQGKRLRPLLLLMSCDAFGGNVEDALSPAFAVELFHNFSLVHDDIMDKADIRRGQPTVHKQFGLNAGILAGDAMLAYAYQYLTVINLPFIPPVLSVFNKTAIQIFEGQQMDVDFEQRSTVAEEEYLKMIEFKTSVLLGCCLQIGAIIGGATAADQHLIYDFGLQLGLSFQIKDDYLDAFGDEQKVGKKIGGDILQNKKTFLFIQALNKADKNQRKELNNLMADTNADRKIAGIKALFETTGARALTLSKAEELYQKALHSLQKVSIGAAQLNGLAQLAGKINNRDF
jgi:geranylgeranyl diphosphate synthase, type II